MLVDQFGAAVAAARTTAALDEAARLLWRAHAEGHLDDGAAESLAAAVQGRRGAIGGIVGGRPKGRPSGFPARRRPQRTPDRQASLERRRRMAASGALPPALASMFTTGELAALTIIARQVQRGGTCSLPVDAIAAMAGVSRSTVQNAVRQAGRLGLLLMRERRRRGLPSLTNVIKVISGEWSGWLRLAGQGGFRKQNPTNIKSLSLERSGATRPARGDASPISVDRR